MQRFKKYVGREVSLANVKDSARLSLKFLNQFVLNLMIS